MRKHKTIQTNPQLNIFMQIYRLHLILTDRQQPFPDSIMYQQLKPAEIDEWQKLKTAFQFDNYEDTLFDQRNHTIITMDKMFELFMQRALTSQMVKRKLKVLIQIYNFENQIKRGDFQINPEVNHPQQPFNYQVFINEYLTPYQLEKAWWKLVKQAGYQKQLESAQLSKPTQSVIKNDIIFEHFMMDLT